MANDMPPSYLETQLQQLALDDQNPSELKRLVVAVDYGTTYTGFSHVGTQGSHVKTLDDVTCVRDWPGPGRNADYSWKTPSRIAYARDNTSEDDGETDVNAYGFEVLPSMKSITWMKLLLDPTQASKYDDPSLSTSEGSGVLSLPPGKSAVDVSADYLTEAAKFAYKSIARVISIEVLRATPIDFWITVPAVWSDRAKADTLKAVRQAARQAKVEIHEHSQVFLICEPEAAAVAALSALTQGNSQAQVKIGDGVLICDCGGGTVDLTTYHITAIEPKLEFKELIIGTGGKCGSTYIDREFIKWMNNKFGAAFTSLEWSKKGPASRLMKDFEGHKRDFGKNNDPRKKYELQLYMRGVPESASYNDDEGMVKLYNEDLRTMFHPVVTKVLQLLQSQLDDIKKLKHKVGIKTIILVGGFGESVYLNDAIRAWCAPLGIRLLCPEHAQSAIVRGAALSGLHSIQPTSRRSRRYYGFSVHEAFDKMRHKEADAFIWPWDGTKRAAKNMEWRLCKGARVDRNTSIKFSLYHDVYNNEPATVDVFACDSDEAPAHQDDNGVYKVAEIRQDFSNADFRGQQSRVVQGRLLRNVNCEYTINFGDRRGVLVFSCSCNGRDIGNTAVQFDGQNPLSAGGVNASAAGGYVPQCAMQ